MGGVSPRGDHTMTAHPANKLFHFINQAATPAGEPAWGSPEWQAELRASTRRGMNRRLIDIEAMDPLNHRKSSVGHDQQVEHEERERDYQDAGGMK